MADKATGTEDTVAVPGGLAQGTTRGSDPAVAQPTSPRPVGTVTRASSPTLARGPSNHEAGDYEELQEVDPAHYTIVAEIARGGMGRILEVRDRRLGRSVAIKEVLHADETTLARFEREVRITARLQHPAIVHVHEAGVWPNGKPFYVMKLIRGKPLDVRISKTTTLAERLEILPAVTTVVDALAYAHSQRVIHRDLKPANVLVGDFGETIVIDWGIAKELGDQAEIVSIPIEQPQLEAPTETVAGSVIGTPSYMPPEQAAGERVDARADVYSLGAMLYQLLAGVPPFVGRTTAEVLAKVIDSDPEPLAKIDPDIPADLIAIVDKAMAKEPRDRFPTANEMATELKRFQQGKLVESHRYTLSELVRRWLRRYRLPVTVAVIMLGVLAVLAVFGVARIVSERDRADQEARVATLAADEGLIKFAEDELDRDPRASLDRLAQLSPGSPQWATARLVASDVAARGVSEVLAPADGAEIYRLAFSPDGTKLASHGASGTPVVWDLATRTKQTLYPANKLFSIGFSSNDTLVGIDFQNTEWRWTLGNPQGTKGRTFEGRPIRGTLSPDATKFVAVDFESCSLTDLATGTTRTLGPYFEANWTIDGRTLLLFDEKQYRVDRMDVATGAVTRQLATRNYRRITHLTGDPTHTWFSFYEASRQGGRSIIADGITYAPLSERELVSEILATPWGGVLTSAEAPNASGDDEITGEFKGTLISVDPLSLHQDRHAVMVFESARALPTVLHGHRSRVRRLALAGTLLATADERGEIRLWRVPRIGRIAHDQVAVNQALLSPDKRELVMARRGPRFEALDLSTGRSRMLEVDNPPPSGVGEGRRNTFVGDFIIQEPINGESDEVIALAQPRTGTRFATVDQAKRAIVWDLATGKGHIVSEGVKHVAISPDGKRLATATETSYALWDLETGAKLAERGDDAGPSAITVGSNGSLVLGFRDGGVYQIESHLAPIELAPITRRVIALAFSPDNTIVVGGGDDAVVRVWDLPHRTVRNFIGHSGSIIAVAFSPDGTHVATSGADKEIRIWSLADGSSVRCTGHTEIATNIQFDDHDTVISSSLDRTARVCDVHSGHSRALIGQTTPVVFASHVTPSRIVTVDRFGQILEHADNLPHGELLLRAWIDSARSVIP